MLKDIHARTKNLPAALKSRPRIRPDCRGFYDAFHVLSGQRNHNDTGLLPIGIGEVLAFADGTGIPRGDQFAKLLRHITALDRVYREFSRKKTKT